MNEIKSEAGISPVLSTDGLERLNGLLTDLAGAVFYRDQDEIKTTRKLLFEFFSHAVSAEREACAETVAEWARINGCPAAVAAADAIREPSNPSIHGTADAALDFCVRRRNGERNAY